MFLLNHFIHEYIYNLQTLVLDQYGEEGITVKKKRENIY